MGLDFLSASEAMEHSKQHLLSQEGLNIISIPKTIDNDVWEQIPPLVLIQQLILHDHRQTPFHSQLTQEDNDSEVMGHNAGWIALYSGIAGCGDVILSGDPPIKKKRLPNTL